MKFELRRLARNCTNEEIIAEVNRVDSLIGKGILTTTDFNKYAKIYSQTARKRFGSWEKVLIAAGLEHKYSNRPEFQKARKQKYTDEEIIAEAKRIAKVLCKESVTMEEFKHNSKISMHPESVRRRFGSWVGLIEKAGLGLSSKYRRRYSNEEYFENLLNVWTYHGRQPFYREMDESPSTISSGAYEGRFGSWRKALEAFVAKMNEGDGESNKNVNPGNITVESVDVSRPERSEPKHRMVIPKPEERRGINLSLRYKVFVRDNFRCVSCGRSPATEIGVKLHIDHKIPFSKGGKSTIDNLQTLCHVCNLGKRDQENI